MSSSKERLLSYISYIGITKQQFEKSIGASNGFINSVKSLSSSKYLNTILDEYPNLNRNWLLFGDGEMLLEDDSKPQLEKHESKGVPYYEDICATCSIAEMIHDAKEIPTFFINYEHFNDCQAYIPVVGDSMYPMYCSGEIIAVKQIFNFDVILWGEAYLIVTNDEANNLRTIKLLYQHEDDDKVILRASNPNYRGDTVIEKKNIISLFIIKGKIKRNQF